MSKIYVELPFPSFFRVCYLLGHHIILPQFNNL